MSDGVGVHDREHNRDSNVFYYCELRLFRKTQSVNRDVLGERLYGRGHIAYGDGDGGGRATHANDVHGRCAVSSLPA